MRVHLFAAAAAVVLISSQALADDRGDLKVTVKAGVGGFTGELNDISSTGPVWGAAVTLQPIKMLGLELGYEGSRFSLTDDRFSLSTPGITRHGGNALLKIAPPFIEVVKPFLGVGMGASYVGVNQEGLTGYRGDVMEEIPLAAGLELNAVYLTAGMRATYRVLLDEGFAASAGQTRNLEGGLFDVAATLGGRF
jgi:hypothetical protein